MASSKIDDLKDCGYSSSLRCNTNSDEVIDWLNKLPNDIRIHIVSSLSMKESARTSILSHGWKDIWRYRCTLNFEDPTALKRMYKHKMEKGQERTKFISWVNNVMNNHIGLSVDELKIVFDLKECPIDKWMDFAFEKNVKILDLSFLMGFGNRDFTPLPLKCLPHNLTSKNCSMTHLRLQQVDITTEALEHILNSLPLLEHLCISWSYALTSLRISGMSSKLTYVKVFDCHRLEMLDISTPKLLSFEYYGCPLNLRVANASSLSKVFVGGRMEWPIEPSLHSLNQYFPQLERLHLRIFLHFGLNLGIKQVPALSNLKHLKLEVRGEGNESLLGWIPLIEASPLLQNLTLKILEFYTPKPMCLKIDPQRLIHKQDGKPLKCLKSLELLGFVGYMIELEFATYVLEKAGGLEQVIISCNTASNVSHGRAKDLDRKLPQGARFILMESA